ncbi:MAG: NAD(P)-dependent glycerol-3-phosphate dehydrogenase [Burkholderiales bacterium]|nr:NAD(P)-dependent glycerol-3-phosphate dehydrogenase [Burkholderiales bacterium]
MKVLVLGAGAWGTAVASHIAQRHATVLWGRDPHVVAAINGQHENPRYLPGLKLSEGLQATTSLSDALYQTNSPEDLWVFGAPMSALRSNLTDVMAHAEGRQWPAFCWLCKGFEVGSGKMPHQVVQDVLPNAHGGALTGPSFAAEVAKGLPFALVMAGGSAATQQTVVEAMHHSACRVYVSEDVVGAEVAGAVKNIMAVATGICDGLGLGLNARAALITRGMAEIRRLATALGGQTETLTGLAGFGDLILTCTGDLSRNRRVGTLLASGKNLDQILLELGQVAEGVKCAPVVKELARELGIDMPVTETVCDVLFSGVSAQSAVLKLLARDPRREA